MAIYAQQYFDFLTNLLQTVADESGAAIQQAAEAVAEAVERGGLFLLYGSGHSALLARDAAYRAGGLAPALSIDDVAEGDAERLEGLAKYIVARYDLRPENVLAII